LDIFIPKFRVARESINSTVAIFTADSALEWCLFSNRDNPATSPTVPPQPAISIGGATYQIHRGGSSSTCPSGQNIDYRVVGNYRGISRSLEVYEAVVLPPLGFLADTGGTLIANLVSYWKLDEISGTRFDSWGNNDLTDVNTVTSNSGVRGEAAQFTATLVRNDEERLAIADNVDVSVGDIPFTFVAWVRLDQSSKNLAIFSKGDTGATREYLLFYDNSVDRFAWGVTGPGGEAIRVVADNFGGLDGRNPNSWYFIIVWHDSANNQIGIQVNNGIANTIAHSGGVVDNTSSFNIGAWLDLGDFEWDGRIDEFGFWKKVLTSQERSDLWNSGNGNTLQ